MAARRAAKPQRILDTLSPSNGAPAEQPSPQPAPPAGTEQPNWIVWPHPGARKPIEPQLLAAVRSVEQFTKQQVVLLLSPGSLDDTTRDTFRKLLPKLRREHPISLILDSPGGNARAAYQIASMLRRHCGAFTAVVPRYAKSAATLMCLGASRILMSPNSELGPLDPQLFDQDSEHQRSALDETLSLERLNAFALEVVDRTMIHLLPRTKKRLENLLPKVMSFAVDLTKPLLEKMDPIRYTYASRALKISEEYAIRLLRTQFPETDPTDKAVEIARHLTHKYPEHGFPIEYPEAQSIGLHVELMPEEVARAFDDTLPILGSKSYLGVTAAPSSRE